MQSEYNGAALFSSTILCGGHKEVNIEELNMLRSTWDHAVKTQKVDLGSPAGTISFRVNSGGDGDIYRIWMGDNLVFSMGGYNPDMKSQGAHHSSQQDAKDNSQDLSWDIPGTLANGKAGNGAGVTGGVPPVVRAMEMMIVLKLPLDQDNQLPLSYILATERSQLE